MRKRSTTALLVLLPLIALSAVSCGDKRRLSESQIRSLYKNSRGLDETAAFLAGTDIRKDSPLHPLTQDDRYRAYRQNINEMWERFKTRNLKNMESWRRKHVADGGTGLVMYPFSGPDILNALAFFPAADEYIMIGLELPGTVPDPLRAPRDAVYTELFRVRNALRTILDLNLFRTSEMKADFNAGSFSNIAGIMMFFLARYDYRILDVKKTFIDHGGNVRYGEPPPGGMAAPGVEFTFRKRAGSPVKTARFFSVDLSDGSLTLHRGFSSFLSRQNGFITFIKSASYLLSYDNFRILRAYLLAGSRYLLQEDSGIPYKYFAGNEWKISFYGTYRVLAMFANRMQRDLDEAMRQKSAGPLPFDFGYGFVPEKSNIMIAEKVRRKD
jgi:hypothetical protein